MLLALLLAALLGHAFLWVALVNRLHATALPRPIMRPLTALCFLCALAVPVGLGYWLAPLGPDLLGGFPWLALPETVLAYLAVCWIAAALSAVLWVRRVAVLRPPPLLRSHRTRALEPMRDDSAVTSEENAHHFLVHLPRNESLRLDLTERAIEVPRLAPALEGLSIVQLSDFHFTGRVGKAYFQEVVRLSNQTGPDLVAITGDLVDKSDRIDWVPDTLGRLRARYGVYFILGNHDVRVDMDRLRRALTQSGLIDLGGRWLQVEMRGEPVVLAGNELPWLTPAADLSRCPPRTSDGRPLRIALSHSPDQIGWARANDVDLMLAGHTHGGQIRLPLVGAILTPSWRGVKYASGVFYAPPTILHVTRGVSGEFPVRLNCPPEMNHLVLHKGMED